jgi:hypothetical protein
MGSVKQLEDEWRMYQSFVFYTIAVLNAVAATFTPSYLYVNIFPKLGVQCRRWWIQLMKTGCRDLDDGNVGTAVSCQWSLFFLLASSLHVS